MQSASVSAAPIGDMMVIVGDALLGPGNGRTFMLIEAATVFLALIGTTLSCMNTGARVTYAMGKDKEVRGHFGALHGKKSDPAQRDLDFSGDLSFHRLYRRWVGLWGQHSAERRNDCCHSPRLLVEFRLHDP